MNTQSQKQNKAKNLLSEYVSVHSRFARSAYLDRDIDRREPLEGYVVTARALNVIERIAQTASSGESGGAWSLTGPYGSGKSSLALLLDATFGPASPIRDKAWELIHRSSSRIGELIFQSHHKYRTSATGFHRGIVTAQPEPLEQTIFRALYSAVIRRYSRIPTIKEFPAASLLRREFKISRKKNSGQFSHTPGALLEIAQCLASDAPLLLIIDEFGKCLEYIRDNSDSDPYLLQLLSESGQGSGLPIFFLTLQHRSFEEYLSSSDWSCHSEWNKVQGRFEDIVFFDSTYQSRAVIGSVFESKSHQISKLIDCWSDSIFEELKASSVTEFSNRQEIAGCYPLHPLTTLVLPELCNRYGQHERTMFSFLTSADSASATTFLSSTKFSHDKQLPSVGLDLVFDYFVTNGTLSNLSTRQASRWIEIATRLRDIRGLSKQQLKLAKTIALLNLITTSGTLRASKNILSLTARNVTQDLKHLEKIGVIVYRNFADEYRIWHGTDIDINSLIEAAKKEVQKKSLLEILSSIDSPLPIVAARHSAKHNTFRVFSKRYTECREVIQPIDTFSPFDGEILLVVGPDKQIPRLKQSNRINKPVLAAVPNSTDSLDAVARDVATIATILNFQEIQNDWVALRELQERLAQLQTRLHQEIHNTFDASKCQWFLLTSQSLTELSGKRENSIVSEVADFSYPFTPKIRNEMLNRSVLSSQGARAQRLVLQAMVKNGTLANLGLEGYGPEVAIYKSLLSKTGMHKFDKRNQCMTFSKPSSKSSTSLINAWQVVEDEFKRAKNQRVNFEEIFESLILPPIGMKQGAIPIFITAAFLVYQDEIAIYERGTFNPLLTPEMLERMVKNPSHFEFKHFANSTNARRIVIDTLAKRFQLKPKFRKHRVSNVLNIVNHIVLTVNQLNDFAVGTNCLSSRTIEVRDTILSAVEPDLLIFESLPRSVNLPEIFPDSDTYDFAKEYAKRMSDALTELSSFYANVLDEMFKFLLESCAETCRLAITGQAASLRNEILNPDIQAFVSLLADCKYSDADWIEAVATVVSNKAPRIWTDDDYVKFKRDLPHNTAAFQRLVALHTWNRLEKNDAFIPYHITVTKHDGQEVVKFVSVNQKDHQNVTMALESVLDNFSDLVGSNIRTYDTLLALLCERMLAESQDNINSSLVETTTRKSKNG